MSRRHLSVAMLFACALLFAPSSVLAGQSGDLHHITISSDREFDRAHGVKSGRGTVRDPYVITGLETESLTISDTTKAVRIVKNNIGSLTLNWIGRHVEVRNNDIRDLRVNENVERTGAPTSGLITQNRFDSVSQIRHFDGRFTHNTVGRREWVDEPIWQLWPVQAVNFDGFNGARFERNTVFGTVDVRLHGHHHSSQFGGGSHMHEMASHEHHKGHMKVDHSKRFHEVFVGHNTIYSNGSHALSYLDTGHSANDQTATSEQEPELEAPHVHYMRAAFAANKLVGAGILVDVFNARDRLHTKGTPSGSLDLIGNSITLAPTKSLWAPAMTGIYVRDAQHLTLRIVKNKVTAPEVATQEKAYPWNTSAGVALEYLEHANVTIDTLKVENRQYAIRAYGLSDSVRWTIKRLTASGTEQDVSYEQSSEPRRQ